MNDPITIDQQLQAFGQQVKPEQMGGNRLLPCRLGLEPLGCGIRVTARDECGGMLWGFVASAPSLASGECLVAVYDGLRELLEQYGLNDVQRPPSPEKMVVEASGVLDEIASTIAALKRSIEVKQVTDATGLRAEAILATARDASRMLSSVKQR